MTTLNTIIEEEMEKFDEYFVSEDVTGGKTWSIVGKNMYLVKAYFTTAMQRAYEAGQGEERARIRESFNEWFKKSTEDVEDWAERVIK